MRYQLEHVPSAAGHAQVVVRVRLGLSVLPHPTRAEPCSLFPACLSFALFPPGAMAARSHTQKFAESSAILSFIKSSNLLRCVQLVGCVWAPTPSFAVLLPAGGISTLSTNHHGALLHAARMAVSFDGVKSTSLSLDINIDVPIPHCQVCVDELKALAKAEGVTALPRMLVYQPGRGLLTSIDVPFSKVRATD